MNIFEKILYFLQGIMDTPIAYGWFHWLWIILSFFIIFFLYKIKDKHSDKQLKIILSIYGFIALLLEILKQLIWSFNYDKINNIVTWDYQWYAFPFQLCTTPIIVCIVCLFLKKGKIRTALLSYLSFVTILGSIATVIYPVSCFVPDTLINIHAMWLHFGSFVVSIYLIMCGEIKPNKTNFIYAIIAFLISILLAQLLNISIYNSGVLNGETFNMYYISPYFISSLPVFDIIQQNVPYVIYLLIYILALSLGAYIVWFISSKLKHKENTTL